MMDGPVCNKFGHDALPNARTHVILCGAPVRVVELAGRGLGMVTTRAVAANTVLFVEPPVFVSSATGSMVDQFCSLSDENLEALWSLSDSGEPKTLLGIARTNGVAVARDQGAIFLAFSRINHACLPTEYDADTQRQSVIALTAMNEGEGESIWPIDLISRFSLFFFRVAGLLL